MFLEVDHVNNDGASMRAMGLKGVRWYAWLVGEGFPPGVAQLLCANCNQGKARNGGVCPHKQPHSVIRETK